MLLILYLTISAAADPLRGERVGAAPAAADAEAPTDAVPGLLMQRIRRLSGRLQHLRKMLILLREFQQLIVPMQILLQRDAALRSGRCPESINK